jgi:hypothetical protein
MPKKKNGKQSDQPSNPDEYTFTVIHNDSTINGRKYYADSFQSAAQKAIRDFKALSSVELYCLELDEYRTISSNSVISQTIEKNRAKERRMDRRHKQHQQNNYDDF